jgi:hypothetical protein
MKTCTIEVGLLRKHPCGHAAVAACLNCDQPLCVEHSVAQLTDGGQRTGKFMCKECVAAAKEHAKSMTAVARSHEAKKLAALDKATREQLTAPPAPKKPPASTPHAPAQPAAAAAEQPKEPAALEFTPKDGKLSYTTKKNGPG